MVTDKKWKEWKQWQLPRLLFIVRPTGTYDNLHAASKEIIRQADEQKFEWAQYSNLFRHKYKARLGWIAAIVLYDNGNGWLRLRTKPTWKNKTAVITNVATLSDSATSMVVQSHKRTGDMGFTLPTQAKKPRTQYSHVPLPPNISIRSTSNATRARDVLRTTLFQADEFERDSVQSSKRETVLDTESCTFNPSKDVLALNQTFSSGSASTSDRSRVNRIYAVAFGLPLIRSDDIVEILVRDPLQFSDGTVLKASTRHKVIEASGLVKIDIGGNHHATSAAYRRTRQELLAHTAPKNLVKLNGQSVGIPIVDVRKWAEPKGLITVVDRIVTLINKTAEEKTRLILVRCDCGARLSLNGTLATIKETKRHLVGCEDAEDKKQPDRGAYCFCWACYTAFPSRRRYSAHLCEV